MDLDFHPQPGRHERDLKRRHGNPLYADPPHWYNDGELQTARLKDLQELDRYNEDFQQLMQQATALAGNEQSDVILALKARLDQAFERASGLQGDLTTIKSALIRLLDAIMQAVIRGAGQDKQALSELVQEVQARRTHFALLEYSLVADLLDPASPIGSDDLIPALLSEPCQNLDIALGLFDAEQLAGIYEQARGRVAGLGTGRPGWEQMQIIEARVSSL